MSLCKISPGVYIAVIPPSLEECFEYMCDDFASFQKDHPLARQADDALVQEPSPTDPDDHRSGSLRRPVRPAQSTEDLCDCSTLARPGRPPKTGGPPPARPDPCRPKGHVIVMMPEVPPPLPRNVPPPRPDSADRKGHVVIVMPADEEPDSDGPRPSQPPPPRPDPCIPKGHRHDDGDHHHTAPAEPSRSPRSTPPQQQQRSGAGEDILEAGSAPPSSSATVSSTTTAWEATASAPDAGLTGGKVAEKSSAAECLICGERFMVPGWYEQ